MALLCFLPPVSLEGSLPKGPGASTHLSLKKMRAPLRGLGPATALVCCSGLCCSPVGGEQEGTGGSIDRKQQTKPDQGPPVHKPVLRPAGQLVVDPGALATGREAGNRLAGSGAATQPSCGQALRLDGPGPLWASRAFSHPASA